MVACRLLSTGHLFPEVVSPTIGVVQRFPAGGDELPDRNTSGRGGGGDAHGFFVMVFVNFEGGSRPEVLTCLEIRDVCLSIPRDYLDSGVEILAAADRGSVDDGCDGCVLTLLPLGDVRNLWERGVGLRGHGVLLRTRLDCCCKLILVYFCFIFITIYRKQSLKLFYRGY